MNFKISTDSVKAIKQYVSYVESKNGDITRHQALVLSHKEGYPSLTYIGITEKDCYTVIIENLPNKFSTNSFNSNEYKFEYHSTNTLVIKNVKDFSGNHTEVDITYLG